MLRLALALFLVQAGFHGFTASIPLALARAGRPDPEIGAIVGLAPLIQVPAALLGGALIDRFGGLRLVALGGLSYLGATGILLLPGLDPATSTLQFLAARVLQGFGFGIVMPATLSVIPRLVPAARRGVALATAGAAHNLTLVVLPPLSIIALDAAGLDGVALLVAALVVCALVLAFARPFHQRIDAEDTRHHEARRFLGFAFRRSWLAPLSIIALWVVHWGVITAYLPQRAEAAGADIGLFFAADGLFVLLLRVPAGWMADRVAASWQILLGLALTAAGVLLVMPAPTTPVLVLAGALTGAGAALIAVPVTLTLTRRSNDADRGSAFALFSACFAGAIALGSLGAAPVIPVVGYETLLAATIGAIAIGMVIALVDRDLSRVFAPQARLVEDDAIAATLAEP
jgi:MFS family permease